MNKSSDNCPRMRRFKEELTNKFCLFPKVTPREMEPAACNFLPKSNNGSGNFSVESMDLSCEKRECR